MTTSSGRAPSRRRHRRGPRGRGRGAPASREPDRPDADLYYFDQAAAEHICEFFPRFLVHTKGEWAGQPFALEAWQRRILQQAFGWKRRLDGLRRYDTVFVYIARKNGKSQLAAGVGLYLLFGDEEPGAEIYSLAEDRSQAALVFDEARKMCEAAPALKSRCRVFRREIFVASTLSYYRVLSADVQTKHGLNPHGILFDELHTQDDRDLWDTVRTGRGARRQSMTFALTTAGYDKKTLCGEMYEKARQVLRGKVRDDTFLPVLFEAGERDDWEDPKVWAKANPNLGVSVKMENMRAECAEAKTSPAFLNTFLRLRLNRWTRQEHRWIDLKKWDACAGAQGWKEMEETLRGRPCFAALDLSTVTDLCALELVFDSTVESGAPGYPTEEELEAKGAPPPLPGWEFGDPLPAYDLLSFFWCPEEGIRARSKKDRVPYDVFVRDGALFATEGDAVDHGAVRKFLQDLGQKYLIQELAVDQWNAHKLITELEQEDGFTIVRVSQGFGAMTAPTKELDTLYRRRRVRHGGHPVLAWCADNVALDRDPYDNWKPSKKKSRERIDGIVALVMALGRALLGTGRIEDARIETLGG